MFGQNRSRAQNGFLMCLLAGSLLQACQANSLVREAAVEPALTAIDAKEVQRKGQVCADLYQAHIEAWNSREAENLRRIYSEDIVHFDAEPLYSGIDAVAGMAEGMWSAFPDWAMQAGDTYIDTEECMGEWINWGVFGFSEEAPALEFDLLELRDEKISYWRAYYDGKFLDVFGSSFRIDQDLLRAVGLAWSGDDPQAIADLYGEEAVFTDSLFDIALVGQDAVADFAARYQAQFSGVKWELQSAFAEDFSSKVKRGGGFQPQGGVYAITLPSVEGDPCTIQVVVMLTTNEEDQIIDQTIYYQAQDLITCGLAQ